MTNYPVELLLWIPTYNRFAQLVALLKLFETIGVPEWVRIVVSDNYSSTPLRIEDIRSEGVFMPLEIISSKVNYTAGINFLKSFEYAQPSEWIWIHGDDDIPSKNCFQLLKNDLASISNNIAALKYDSSLYGAQKDLSVTSISDYVVPGEDKALFFGNLLLISSWIYRPSLLKPYFPSAILSYNSHMSHVVLLLVALDAGRNLAIRFSSKIATDHNKQPEAWNAAITYLHMLAWWRIFVIQLSSETRSFVLSLIVPNFKTAFRLFALINSSKLIRRNLFFAHLVSSCASWRYLLLTILYPFSYIAYKTYLVLSKGNRFRSENNFDRF